MDQKAVALLPEYTQRSRPAPHCESAASYVAAARACCNESPTVVKHPLASWPTCRLRGEQSQGRRTSCMWYIAGRRSSTWLLQHVLDHGPIERGCGIATQRPCSVPRRLVLANVLLAHVSLAVFCWMHGFVYKCINDFFTTRALSTNSCVCLWNRLYLRDDRGQHM